MSDLFWLTDALMARIAPFFPKSHGKPRVDDGRVLSGIIFTIRNGLHWHDAPRLWTPQDALQPLEALKRKGHFSSDDGRPRGRTW